MPVNCPAVDTLNLAYIIDNDGDFNSSTFNAVPHVTGVRFISSPNGASTVTYNWWISNGDPSFDFGPQAHVSTRDFTTGGTGTPEGDRNKYYYLSNGEIDYDQVLMASITDTDSIWTFPNPAVVNEISLGMGTKYSLSTGPFDLAPGQEITVALAYVAGENIHVSEANYTNNLHNKYQPEDYLDGLDFTDLDLNATWAEWVYDNPGVDTDSDGYAGMFRVCEGDTIWHKGDGVPDLRADIPPEMPTIWVEPRPGGLHVRWNGRIAEETNDAFSRLLDFEGYRAYLATDLSPTSFAMIGSYDVENFHRLVWNASSSFYRELGEIQTLEVARCLYAPDGCDDSLWHPEDFTRTRPYRLKLTDSIFYFVKVGPNASAFGLETPFMKRFPAAPRPPMNWTADSVSVELVDTYLTDDNYFKYFEYEFTINNLLPDKQYWLSITSLDHGSKIIGASGSESPILGNAKTGTPLSELACCVGFTGNIDCDSNNKIDIADLTALIDHLFIDRNPLCCPREANIDGAGEINIADLTFLIDHLFIDLPSTAVCQ